MKWSLARKFALGLFAGVLLVALTCASVDFYLRATTAGRGSPEVLGVFVQARDESAKFPVPNLSVLAQYEPGWTKDYIKITVTGDLPGEVPALLPELYFPAGARKLAFATTSVDLAVPRGTSSDYEFEGRATGTWLPKASWQPMTLLEVHNTEPPNQTWTQVAAGFEVDASTYSAWAGLARHDTRLGWLPELGYVSGESANEPTTVQLSVCRHCVVGTAPEAVSEGAETLVILTPDYDETSVSGVMFENNKVANFVVLPARFLTIGVILTGIGALASDGIRNWILRLTGKRGPAPPPRRNISRMRMQRSREQRMHSVQGRRLAQQRRRRDEARKRQKRDARKRKRRR